MIEDGPTQDGQSALVLDGMAAGVDNLEAILVFFLSASQLYASWLRPRSTLRPSLACHGLRETFLAAEQASLGADLRPTSHALSLTLESGGRTTLVTRVRGFGIAAIFEENAPLGFARMAHKQLARTLEHDLPYGEREGPAVVVASARPTQKASVPAPADLEFGSAIEPGPDTVGARPGIGDRVRAILRYLEDNAADPHLVVTRVALRTGLGREGLASPDNLATEALLLVETAAEDILGLEHGKLTEAAPP